MPAGRRTLYYPGIELGIERKLVLTLGASHPNLHTEMAQVLLELLLSKHHTDQYEGRDMQTIGAVTAAREVRHSAKQIRRLSGIASGDSRSVREIEFCEGQGDVGGCARDSSDPVEKLAIDKRMKVEG